MSEPFRLPSSTSVRQDGNSGSPISPVNHHSSSSSPLSPTRSILANGTGSRGGPSPSPATAPDVGFAPPPYSEQPTYSAPRQFAYAQAGAHAVSVVTGGQAVPLPPLPPHKRRSLFEPLELPSPFAKAPKSRVSNFREGLREGGLGAWAEVREGLKGPIGLTYYWAKEGGAIGAINGLGYGTAILALCPISACVALLNHSSRGAIRSARSAKERRREKKTAPQSSGPGSTSGPLSINRTGTMESTRSRRSRVGTLISRVTSTRSASGPITPEDERSADAQTVRIAEGSDEGRITPFTPTSPAGDWATQPRVAGKQKEPTRLEMDTKWGGPTSPSAAGPSASGSRIVQADGAPTRLEGINQIELDTKWGASLPPLESTSASAGAPNQIELDTKLGGSLPPLEPSAPPARTGVAPNQIELDTKWGLSALPPLEPLPLPHHPWQMESEAGPSNRGTPQLERDIKWPLPASAGEGLTEYPEYQEPARSSEVERRVSNGQEDPPTFPHETSGLEMQLKWENEMARAGSG